MDDDNVRTKIFIGDYISIGVLEKRLLDIIQKKEKLLYFVQRQTYQVLSLSLFFLSCCRSTYFLSPPLSICTHSYIFDLTLLYTFIYLSICIFISQDKKTSILFY